MQGDANFKITKEIKLTQQRVIFILLKISYFGKLVWKWRFLYFLVES